MTKRLSKSRFMAGLQCHRQLWWRVHEPRAPELKPDVMMQAVFDRGTRVGELAQQHVPGGVLIDFPFYMVQQKVNATRSAIEAGASILYEASFLKDGLFAAVDILERVDGGWAVVEVKSTLDLKEQHVPDIAFQAHLVARAGLSVTGIELMHLNRDCHFPDLSNLFVREDVTEGAGVLASGIPKEATAQFAILDGPLPEVPIGDRCDTPYECPFKGRCWPEMPSHHLTSLYGTRRSQIEEWIGSGYETLFELPDHVELNCQADRQRRAVKSGRMVVEPGLAEALEAFEAPVAFLDFETIMPAVPVWNGCRPYQQLPVQFSCHVPHAGGGLDHHSWLAEGPGDPREELAHHLLDACRDAGTILAYNAGFEKRCIRGLSEAVPELAPDLDRVADHIEDLLPVVRNYVYHPDFHGSFSIKSVLPALVPGEGYDGLAVSEGATASFLLEDLLLGEATPDDDSTVREDLLRYCKQDTWAMVLLYEELRKMAACS